MDYDKLHYRRNENGIVRYSPEGDEGDVATLQQRTAIGKFKDGSIYLRASDAEDLAKAKAAADALGLTYTQRRGGASHFGRTGSYEHLHFGHPQDALSVHAALGYHLEDQGKPADHEVHLQKLSGGMHGHVQGKDARADACMLNSQHAHQMSLDANKADTPDTHRGAAHFHRLCAEAHQAQASRPWTNGQGAHHAGLAILHEAIAQHHDQKAIASQKRIQAEMKRKAEMRARMEAMEEGRETKKAVDGEEYEMPLDEAIQEHERLVKVLESHDHKDDLEEAKDQGEELAEMKEAKKSLGTCGAGTDLSTLEGGGALRAEGHDDELADATMVSKAVEPTPAQIEAGNYPKKHITVQGLPISIENPKGSIRRGVDKDGHEWESKMAAAYGYFTGVGEAKDGDAPDVFVGPDPENPYVHVVNQVDPKTGKYDEMKVMLGYKSREAAIEGYLANYEKGWKGLGDVKTLHIDDFKEWLRNGDITKRLVIKAATTRLHATSRIQMQYLRVHPGARMSCGFTDAVQAAKGAGLTDAEILRTVSNATGAFAPLVRHLKENHYEPCRWAL